MSPSKSAFADGNDDNGIWAVLSFASGAMIVVVARELLPESVKENKNLSTIGLIGGFVLMMILIRLFI